MRKTIRLQFGTWCPVLIAAASLTGAEPKDFETRWKTAEQNVSSGSGRQYFNGVFFKEFYGRYADLLSQCARQTGQTIESELKAAVELGAEGQVLDVMVRPDSKPTGCFAKRVKRERFSKPPADHFWVPVVIRSTRQ